MKVDLRSVEFCGDSSTTNEARVMHRLFAVTVGASRYGRAERGGVMRRRCFNDESAVSSKLQTKQHIEGSTSSSLFSSFDLSLSFNQTHYPSLPFPSRCNALLVVMRSNLSHRRGLCDLQPPQPLFAYASRIPPLVLLHTFNSSTFTKIKTTHKRDDEIVVICSSKKEEGIHYH
ncbi:hypothetical protein YC2023_083270 [Brassica napus]